MARRGRHEDHENHERWLVSYADFITLLFAFFVVMFATSQSDKAKAQQVSDSVKKALAGQPVAEMVAALLGAEGGHKPQMAGSPSTAEKIPPVKVVRRDAKGPAELAELFPSLSILSKELQEEIQSGRVDINMGPRGLTISFKQAALFPSGEDVIAREAYASLAKVAAAIRRIPNPARLEGHTDSVPIHNARFRSNWDLSAARSIAVLEFVTKECGVFPGQLSVAGYAESAPVAVNDTEEGRARNRRVDIVILNQTGAKGEPERPNR